MAIKKILNIAGKTLETLTPKVRLAKAVYNVAKKNIDVPNEVLLCISPEVLLAKAAYNVAKKNISEVNVELKFDMANEAFRNKKYSDCLKYLQEARVNDEVPKFKYYLLKGLCNFELKKQEGNDIDEARSQAYDDLKECLRHTKEDNFEASKDAIANVYWTLANLSNDYLEQRRFAMAAMAGENIRKDAKTLYIRLTAKMLDNMNDKYERVRKIKDGDLANFGMISEAEKKRIYEESLGGMFSGLVDYYERQFIYIANSVETLAGCYDDRIKWLFTIDALPKELQFPVGHPQPNSLYYAHPTKKGVYLPIENADEELFKDKVRDFFRLVQCLGATEIRYHYVKGHSSLDDKLYGMSGELGGGYKGYEGCVNYDNMRRHANKETDRRLHYKIERFNPTIAPYIPNDVTWLSNDSEWQSLVKKRLEGNMLYYKLRISSKTAMAVTDSRMDGVKAAFKAFVANAHVNYSQQTERSFQREEEKELEFDTRFKPLEDF